MGKAKKSDMSETKDCILGSVIESIDRAERKKEELLVPLKLMALGITVNGGDEEENQALINNRLDMINQINNSL
jgi:hypothetical protein